MFIDLLNLRNFRNYRECTIDFSSGSNFIVGKNGAGKTNILESISVLSTLRSFRSASDRDFIMHGEGAYYCRAEICDYEQRIFEVACFINEGKLLRRMKIDGSEVKRAPEYFGHLLSVTVSPDDLSIVSGGPEHRRRFFDSLISKIDRDYLSTLVRFRKVLSERNGLLKSIRDGRTANSHEIRVWNTMIADLSSVIIEKRLNVLSLFEVDFCESYRRISDAEEPPAIRYKNTASSLNRDEIIANLERRIDKDIAAASTTIGPHRDEYEIIDKNSVRFQDCSSQGQKRTASICIKMAEKRLVERISKKKLLYS